MFHILGVDLSLVRTESLSCGKGCWFIFTEAATTLWLWLQLILPTVPGIGADDCILLFS
jgi:hypothetical protein